MAPPPRSVVFWLLVAITFACCAARHIQPEAAASASASAGGARRLSQQFTGPTPKEIVTSVLSTIITTLNLNNLFQNLVFQKLNTAFLIQEYITIIDSTVSLIESVDTSTNVTTYVPGDFFADLGHGVLIETGVSATFAVIPSSVANGTVPLVGVITPVVSVEGKVNTPARRLLDFSSPLGVSQSPASRLPLAAAAAAAAEEEVKIPRRVLMQVTPVQMGALALTGFWDALGLLLPPQMRANLTHLIDTNSKPLGDFLAAHNISLAAVEAAAQQLEYGVTVASPQLSVPPALTTVIPVLDIEFSFTLLDQANQRGANVRVTPIATRFLGFGPAGIIYESVKVAPFASAWAQVTHAQLETSASQALNATAGLIQGDTTNLQTYLDAQAALIAPQLFPLPEFVTIEFDVYIRAQIQVNGGDIANVL